MSLVLRLKHFKEYDGCAIAVIQMLTGLDRRAAERAVQQERRFNPHDKNGFPCALKHRWKSRTWCFQHEFDAILKKYQYYVRWKTVIPGQKHDIFVQRLPKKGTFLISSPEHMMIWHNGVGYDNSQTAFHAEDYRHFWDNVEEWTPIRRWKPPTKVILKRCKPKRKLVPEPEPAPAPIQWWWTPINNDVGVWTYTFSTNCCAC